MKASFWHEKWRKGDIAFHEAAVNPLLKEHIGTLQLKPGSRLFLPLCGKTKDIAWLINQGHSVVGVELSRIAVEQLFEELAITPKIETLDKLIRYSGPNVKIWVGDIFHTEQQHIGPVDAIYDRAALVALTEDMRKQYAQHLIKITSTAPQLLITYEYNQSVMDGPPFSLTKNDLAEYYAADYKLSLVSQEQVDGGLKGKVEAISSVWYLHS